MNTLQTTIEKKFFTLIALGTLAAWFALANSAAAGLVFNSVRFDVHVKSGSATEIEEHFTNDNFPPVNQVPGIPYHSLPGINKNLPNPFSDTTDLRIELVNSANAPLGPNLYDRSTLWITGSQGIWANNNPDTTLATPIEFETVVYLDNLPADQKLIFPGFRYEPPVPFGTPEFIQVSDNRGSIDDPITILLKFAAGSGHVPLPLGNPHKIHLYWDTMELPPPTVPEPTTCAMLLLGMSGALGVARRRR